MFQVYTNEVYEASAGHVEMHWLMNRPRVDAALPGAKVMGKLALFFLSLLELLHFTCCILDCILRFLVCILQRWTHVD